MWRPGAAAVVTSGIGIKVVSPRVPGGCNVKGVLAFVALTNSVRGTKDKAFMQEV